METEGLAVAADTLSSSVLPGAALPVKWECSGPNIPNLGSLYMLL